MFIFIYFRSYGIQQSETVVLQEQMFYDTFNTLKSGFCCDHWRKNSMEENFWKKKQSKNMKRNISNLLSLSKQMIGESEFPGKIFDACDAIIDTDPAWSEEPTPRTEKKNKIK